MPPSLPSCSALSDPFQSAFQTSAVNCTTNNWVFDGHLKSSSWPAHLMCIMSLQHFSIPPFYVQHHLIDLSQLFHFFVWMYEWLRWFLWCRICELHYPSHCRSWLWLESSTGTEERELKYGRCQSEEGVSGWLPWHLSSSSVAEALSITEGPLCFWANSSGACCYSSSSSWQTSNWLEKHIRHLRGEICLK